MARRIPEDFLAQLSRLDRGIAGRWLTMRISRQGKCGSLMPLLGADEVDAIIGPLRRRPIGERECLALAYLVATMAFTPEGSARLKDLAIELELGAPTLSNVAAFMATAALSRKSLRSG